MERMARIGTLGALAAGCAALAPIAARADDPCRECAADLTGSGAVGVGDLLEMLSCWGNVAPGGACACADLTGGGSVGVEDLLELLGAWGACPAPPPCNADAGDCCSPNGSIGCENMACCECVCKQDSFCCNVTWDGLCAGRASGVCADDCLCDPDPCPSAGICCIDNGSPGCHHLACCECVCAQDPFCCDVTWDSTCAEHAHDACSQPCGCSGQCPTGFPPNNHCTNADFPPGVMFHGDSHTFVGSNLCATYDCAITLPAQGFVWTGFELWEESKVVISYCGSVNTDGGPFGNASLGLVLSCPCTGYTSAGGFAFSCPDGNVEITMHNVPAGTYYYLVLLDQNNGAAGSYNITVTVSEPTPQCGPGQDFGDCCIANYSPGCDQQGCCECVCSQDAFCCDITWDNICAGLAAGVCVESCPCDG